MTQSISIILAVKNEEGNIQTCLDSVKWADETIIIDNGSTDKTIKLAKKYTKKIYSCSEPLLIPELQNIGINKATKDWVLILDADCIVPEKTKREILHKIQIEVYSGFKLRFLTYTCGVLNRYLSNLQVLKLFKRDYGQFLGRLAHESPIVKGKIGIIKNGIIHNAHPSIGDLVQKLNLYSSQDAKKMFCRQKGGIRNIKLDKVSLIRLLFEPPIFTAYLFFFKKGWQNLKLGLIFSIIMGYYLFLERAKLWELQFKLKKQKQKDNTTR